MTDTLSFGAVCEDCALARRLQIENIGDVGTRVSWSPNTPFGPHFTISPRDAFLPPHSPVFEVVFEPKYLADEIVAEGLMCIVEGALPLTLNLTGSCIKMPEDCVKEIDFACAVRKTDAKTIENKKSKSELMDTAAYNKQQNVGGCGSSRGSCWGIG